MSAEAGAANTDDPMSAYWFSSHPPLSFSPAKRRRAPLRPTHRARLALFALLAVLASPCSAADAESDLVWVHQARPTAQAHQLLAALSAAPAHGLRAGDYALGFTQQQLHRLQQGQDAALAGRFDAALSQAALRFVTHLRCGRVQPAALGLQLSSSRCRVEPTELRALAAAEDVDLALTEFEPRAAPYRRLIEALATYRTLAARTDLRALPPAKRSLSRGDEYSGAPQLRRLLLALGDLDAPTHEEHSDEERIDASLVEALVRFQQRHRLEPDGVLGPRTLAALNTPLDERVRQIELTLERWRWLSGVGRPDVLVNVPHFMLYALPRADRPDEKTIEMRVIVGQNDPRMRTPLFASAIEYVVFQPYWDVPRSIAVRELLPLIRKDSGYLARHRMEIVRGGGEDAAIVEPTPGALDALAAGELRLRQRPGPGNALGPIKFVLPNPFGVHLHATSQPRLFERAQRAFSHGCIRVNEPARLAQYVLRNAPDVWDEQRIEAALCSQKTFRVDLATPVRVVIFYATAVAAPEGTILFAPDLYGHDRKLEALLYGERRTADGGR